ncbi:ATP-binding protein [Streptomyces daghestanicus]|uniref:ATPase n=1 Tax=Streptomyces daghestanicus TaxID=66885 RepID=A0ABQ3QD94_9ACTN|nr:ATP-binding protein [Streptomyces daghestanicus]GGU15759.1 ATPase [Streptomyces daghestanicus]GHI35238.1 ATPase [Streptomyces daghestanicus]
MPLPAYPVLRPLSALATAAAAPVRAGRPPAGAPEAGPVPGRAVPAGRERSAGPEPVTLPPVGDRAGFARARRFTRDTPRDWSLEHRADDAVLVVAEPAASAAAHAAPSGDGTVQAVPGLALEPGAPLVTVSGPGEDAPVTTPPADRSPREDGCGLRIAATLAGTWGRQSRPPTGKTVRAASPARPLT